MQVLLPFLPLQEPEPGERIGLSAFLLGILLLPFPLLLLQTLWILWEISAALVNDFKAGSSTAWFKQKHHSQVFQQLTLQFL